MRSGKPAMSCLLLGPIDQAERNERGQHRHARDAAAGRRGAAPRGGEGEVRVLRRVRGDGRQRLDVGVAQDQPSSRPATCATRRPPATTLIGTAYYKALLKALRRVPRGRWCARERSLAPPAAPPVRFEARQQIVVEHGGQAFVAGLREVHVVARAERRHGGHPAHHRHRAAHEALQVEEAAAEVGGHAALRRRLICRSAGAARTCRRRCAPGDRDGPTSKHEALGDLAHACSTRRKLARSARAERRRRPTRWCRTTARPGPAYSARGARGTPRRPRTGGRARACRECRACRGSRRAIAL